MKKIITIGCLVLFSKVQFAQNNPIFYGGQGDGFSMSSFTQNYMPKNYNGGEGDGFSMISFMPNYTPMNYNGGEGDGFSMVSFMPNYTPKNYNGGEGDGFSMISFMPNYTPKNYYGGLGDGWASSVIVLGVLPVELLSFTGHEVENTHVLDWKTSMELNSSHFVVEHSVNATSFAELGMITAAGESKVEKSYQFVNRKPLYGDNFYRLKMVDIDGKFKYSNVILLKYLKNNTSIAVYPNPTAEQLNVTIQGDTKNQQVQCQILDMQGKLLQNHEANLDGNTLTFDVSQYANGLYFMRIHFQNNTEIVKFRISK